MANAERDENSVPTLLAVSSVDGVTPIPVYADPVTHRLLVSLSAVTVTKTITPSGTNGAQTINTQAGSVNFAPSASSLVVTNSTANTNSVIICQIASGDATMTSVQVTQASGSFTIIPNTPPTSATRVNFIVFN